MLTYTMLLCMVTHMYKSCILELRGLVFLLTQPWWEFILPTMQLQFRCGCNHRNSISYMCFVSSFISNSKLLGKKLQNHSTVEWQQASRSRQKKWFHYCSKISVRPTQVTQHVVLRNSMKDPSEAHPSGAMHGTWTQHYLTWVRPFVQSYH
jgi:hypothetical protein